MRVCAVLEFQSNVCHKQWRRQDLVSGGHDDRGAEGASIEAPNVPSAVGYGEGVRSPAEGLGERRGVNAA